MTPWWDQQTAILIGAIVMGVIVVLSFAILLRLGLIVLDIVEWPAKG